MQPYFRDAVPSDLPAIGAILRADDSAEAAPSGAYRTALAEIDRTDGNYVLVAEYDLQIVAVLQLAAVRRLDERGGRRADVLLLRVAPAFAGSGVGEMLVDHAGRRARDLGCSRLQVRCDGADADAHTFWERSGFVHLERSYVRNLP